MVQAKIERRQGQFSAVEFRLKTKQGKLLKDWCSPQEMDAFLKENEFRQLQSGQFETDRELDKKGRLVKAAMQEATDGDAPIGTLDMKTGQGVNNYVTPATPVQGALQRLAATRE